MIMARGACGTFLRVGDADGRYPNKVYIAGQWHPRIRHAAEREIVYESPCVLTEEIVKLLRQVRREGLHGATKFAARLHHCHMLLIEWMHGLVRRRGDNRQSLLPCLQKLSAIFYHKMREQRRDALRISAAFDVFDAPEPPESSEAQEPQTTTGDRVPYAGNTWNAYLARMHVTCRASENTEPLVEDYEAIKAAAGAEWRKIQRLAANMGEQPGVLQRDYVPIGRGIVRPVLNSLAQTVDEIADGQKREVMAHNEELREEERRVTASLRSLAVSRPPLLVELEEALWPPGSTAPMGCLIPSAPGVWVVGKENVCEEAAHCTEEGTVGKGGFAAKETN